jgi:hypothetical protein
MTAKQIAAFDLLATITTTDRPFTIADIDMVGQSVEVIHRDSVRKTLVKVRHEMERVAYAGGVKTAAEALDALAELLARLHVDFETNTYDKGWKKLGEEKVI